MQEITAEVKFELGQKQLMSLLEAQAGTSGIQVLRQEGRMEGQGAEGGGGGGGEELAGGDGGGLPGGGAGAEDCEASVDGGGAVQRVQIVWVCVMTVVEIVTEEKVMVLEPEV